MKEGDLSPEEAEEKLLLSRQKIFADRTQDADFATRKKRYAQIERAIDAALQNGKLSHEDAKKKLNAARKKIFPD